MKNRVSPFSSHSQADAPLSADPAVITLLDNLDDSYILVDHDLNVVVANKMAITMSMKYFNFQLNKGICILDMALPERRDMLRKLYVDVLNGATHSTETVLPCGDTVRYFENSFNPAISSEGNTTGVIVTTRDITSRKLADAAQAQAKEQLRLSEVQYRTLFQSIPQPCWIYDSNSFTFIAVNDAAVKHYGFTREEFLGFTLFDIHPDSMHERLKERLRRDASRGSAFYRNWQHRTSHDRVIFVDLRITPIRYREIDARLVVANDITAKVVIENELRNSNERFQYAAMAASEALWEWNAITREAYISPTYKEILGWDATDFRKFDEWESYVHPEDREKTVSRYNAILADPKQNKWEDQYRYLKSDGSYAYVSDRAMILRDEDGSVVKVIGACQNITRQKEVEEELKRSNERFLLVSKATSDAIWDLDFETNEIYWSEGLQTLFGFQPCEVTKPHWVNLIHPDLRDAVVKGLDDAVKHPRKKFWKAEYYFCRADGTYAYVLDRGFILRNKEGKATRMIGSMQDISELKTQEQLLSLERRIFELTTDTGVDLKEIVTQLLTGIESIHPEAFTSVLLLSEKGTISNLAAPSLPAAYTGLLEGLAIGPEAGSCGAAMFHKKTVIVSDICTDPLWEKYRDLVKPYGLKACWSLPIVLPSGKVIGTFAVYYKVSKYPTPMELNSVERMRNILRIIMENRLSLQEIRKANERFDIMMKATHDLIWDWDLVTNQIYRDPAGLKKVYGLSDNSGIEVTGTWLRHIHEEDRTRVANVINNILNSVNENNFDVDYRFLRDDGSYSYVYDRGIIIRDEAGKPIRMIGAAQDISDRKRLEKELLQNELEHQKAINQATVETQEQERTEIGKELHDNVNQVLTTTKLYLDLASTNPEMKDELIQKSSRNIINVINEIRQLSRSLMDPSIGDLGLIDSIHDLIENINLTRKLHVSLKATKSMEALMDKNQKLTIFRIIQEALNNAIRHAKATTVVITLAKEKNTAKVTIEDDGIGFNLNTIKKGAGLKNMQNRIYLINGTHSLESVPGKGSKIHIRFPLNESKTEQPE